MPTTWPVAGFTVSTGPTDTDHVPPAGVPAYVIAVPEHIVPGPVMVCVRPANDSSIAKNSKSLDLLIKCIFLVIYRT